MIVAAVPGRQVVVREPLFFLPRLLIIQRIRLWGHVQGGTCRCWAELPLLVAALCAVPLAAPYRLTTCAPTYGGRNAEDGVTARIWGCGEMLLDRGVMLRDQSPSEPSPEYLCHRSS